MELWYFVESGFLFVVNSHLWFWDLGVKYWLFFWATCLQTIEISLLCAVWPRIIVGGAMPLHQQCVFVPRLQRRVSQARSEYWCGCVLWVGSICICWDPPGSGVTPGDRTVTQRAHFHSFGVCMPRWCRWKCYSNYKISKFEIVRKNYQIRKQFNQTFLKIYNHYYLFTWFKTHLKF